MFQLLPNQININSPFIDYSTFCHQPYSPVNEFNSNIDLNFSANDNNNINYNIYKDTFRDKNIDIAINNNMQIQYSSRHNINFINTNEEDENNNNNNDKGGNNVRKGIHCKFTFAEDQRLKTLVKLVGTKDWVFIAKHMIGRNSRQCRERWMNYLDPQLCRDEWSSEEDELLLQKYSEIGPRWTLFVKFFNNKRTDAMIKNRFKKLQRQDKKQKKRAEKDFSFDSTYETKMLTQTQIQNMQSLQMQNQQQVKSPIEEQICYQSQIKTQFQQQQQQQQLNSNQIENPAEIDSISFLKEGRSDINEMTSSPSGSEEESMDEFFQEICAIPWY